MPLQILSVASEIYPLVKTGGLADVAGALAIALRPADIAVRTLVPGYPAVLQAIATADVVHEFPNLFGAPAHLLLARVQELDLLVLDAPHLYARPGGPYRGPDGSDWPDNALRFAALGAAAGVVGRGEVAAFVPDIVHGHDWQSGLALAYLHYGGGRRPGLVMTVHNLAFQGQYPAALLGVLGLPALSYAADGVEYYGGIGYLKAGLWCADRITTVSPTYAAEIMTDAGGMGLGGLLRQRAGVLSGILNGLDIAVWDPAHDPQLAASYDASAPQAARARNKAALQKRLGLTPDPEALLFGAISRLEWQKGFDLLADEVPTLVAAGAQFALLGSGDPTIESRFVSAIAEHPGQIGGVIGYNEPLAHQIQGGCDALLVPSRFEPCGLTQLAALRYGALPVVSRVGGLADTVIDANEMAIATGVATGVQFQPVTREHLGAAITRTAALWRDKPLWRRLQRNGMTTDVSWERPAQRYAALFRDLATRR